MKTKLKSRARNTNSVINRLYTGYIKVRRTGNIIICELGFYFHVARDRPEFRVNVKECWILSVTRENAKYFLVTEPVLIKGYRRTLLYASVEICNLVFSVRPFTEIMIFAHFVHLFGH